MTVHAQEAQSSLRLPCAVKGHPVIGRARVVGTLRIHDVELQAVNRTARRAAPTKSHQEQLPRSERPQFLAVSHTRQH